MDGLTFDLVTVEADVFVKPKSSSDGATTLDGMHSPPRRSQRGSQGGRARANPSVTPRKFKKFFTPRMNENLPSQPLNDIAAPAFNRVARSRSTEPFRDIDGQENASIGFPRESKRRKVFHTPDTTPVKGTTFAVHNDDSKMSGLRSSPCERAAKDTTYIEEDSNDEREYPSPEPLKRITTMQSRGLGAQLLLRDIGSSARRHHVYPVDYWKDRTANFYTRPQDVHTTMSLSDSGRRTIPFCIRSLNRSEETLVAVGDEEGRVRILETAKGSKPSFKNTVTHYRVHANAIIDMDYSNDDALLATASGDQSARVYDVHAEATTAVLGSHTATLKQVRFQPGANNGSILATSARDGSIHIWDLRCNGLDGPIHQIYAPVEGGNPPRSSDTKLVYGRPVNSIYDAHKPISDKLPLIYGNAASIADRFSISTPEVPGSRAGDVSVTALQFLPTGREHLLLSVSEADTSVKLWDIRQIHNKARRSLPLATTARPQSHNHFRQFGINSLDLNSDGSRFYTLCKDNTVYAYSTEHLLLGSAPQLSSNCPPRPAATNANQEGLGPLYGFRHPKLHATSFYVKTSIRKAKHGKCEMLAVGSTDGCAVLFPTDERYLPKSNALLSTDPSLAPTQKLAQSRPTLLRSSSSISQTASTLLISTHGTALIRGHDREVGSLAWTSAGELVTIGDDYLVRVWREGRKKARSLRVEGEAGGARWASGWAEMEEGYDERSEW